MTAPLNGKKLFGAGQSFATLNASNPTPIRFGLVQDQSITFKRGAKEIYGPNQLAADVSSGEMSVTGKVTTGTTSARIFTDLLFADAGSTGQIAASDNELGTVAGATPYIITVANSTTWTQDLGVTNVTTGARMARVASAPVAGASYTVAAGVYTFAAGDEGKAMKTSYLYSIASAGESVTLSNQPMGKVGNFTAAMVFPWTPPGGAVEQDVLTLNSCLATDYEISTKMGDYGKPPFSFSAGCDTTDTLGTFSFAEAA
jgi:hypothetical protein